MKLAQVWRNIRSLWDPCLEGYLGVGLGLRVRHEFFLTIKLKPLRPMVQGNNLKAKRSDRTTTFIFICPRKLSTYIWRKLSTRDTTNGQTHRHLVGN